MVVVTVGKDSWPIILSSMVMRSEIVVGKVVLGEGKGRERRKEGRKEGGREGRKEGRKEGR